MEEKKITTQDIIPLKQKDMDDILGVISRLSDLSKEYFRTDDLMGLESIKRRFNAELQYFAPLYGKIKAYKGPNHTYLEEQVHKIKSDTISLIMLEGVKATPAEGIYRTQPYYIERMEVVLKIKQFFEKVENLYKQYDSTLQSIIQSISVAGKEYNNSKFVN
jgi:hypothetical protein